MTTEIYHSTQNISYKYKFSVLVAIIFLCLSWLFLQGSVIEQELSKYILPLIAGGSVGLYIGHLLDIRNGKGEWSQIEDYIQHHSEINFSHGVCPTCSQQHYPTIYEFHKN